MTSFDVVIVGGGIIGGAVAWELARTGRRVVLVDRQQPGLEASWAAGGILSPSFEVPEALALVPLARASLALYPDFIAAVESATGHATGFTKTPASRFSSATTRSAPGTRLSPRTTLRACQSKSFPSTRPSASSLL